MMFSQYLNIHRIYKRLAKTLIRLRICAGWSEALLVPHTTYHIYGNICFCLNWFLRPISNLSVIKGWVFLGWTSTKLGLICLAQGHNTLTPVRLKPAAPRSRASTLPLSHCPPYLWKFHVAAHLSAERGSHLEIFSAVYLKLPAILASHNPLKTRKHVVFDLQCQGSVVTVATLQLKWLPTKDKETIS